MKAESRDAYLRDEYLLLQKAYEDFDARVITIKGWSATIGLAAIGGGFYETPYLWLFAAGAACVFWVLEAMWKAFQYLNVPRIQRIEAAFRDDDFTHIAPLQIHAAWFDGYRQRGLNVLGLLSMPIILFPHALTAAVGLGLFIAEKAHWLTVRAVPRRRPVRSTPRGEL